jgi:hypothetical protein
LGEHCIQSLNGSHTIREASTCSAMTSARNMASGFRAPQRRFFTTGAARSSTPPSRVTCPPSSRDSLGNVAAVNHA